MKKIIFALTVFMTAGVAAVFGQAATMGSVIIDPYYGAPNLGKTLTESVSSTNTTLGNVTGIGPAGIRVEYMIADRIGVGVDAIYNSFATEYSHDSLNSDGSLYKTYTGNVSMSRLRIHARFNYHFNITNPDVDAYFGVGAGTNMRFWKADASDSEYNTDDLKGSGTLLPVSARICTGIRYYFTENIGLNAEIGLGGPLVSGGISFKF